MPSRHVQPAQPVQPGPYPLLDPFLTRPARQAPLTRPALPSTLAGWATPPRDDESSQKELEMGPLTPRYTSIPQAVSPTMQDILERYPKSDQETGLVLPLFQDTALQELRRPSPIDWEEESCLNC